MEDFVAPKADIEEEQGFVAPAQDIVDNGEKKNEFSSPAPESVGSTSSASTLSMDVLKPQNNPKTPDLTGVGAFAPPTNLQDFNKPQETERVEKVIQKRIANPTLLPVQQAAQQNPSRDTHFLLGNEYLKSGDYEQAIMSFDEAANFPQKETGTLLQDKAFGQQIASNDDALAYGIGKAYQKLGKNEDAKRMWEVALEKNPNNVEALKGLAWDAYNNDDATKATYLSAAAQAAQEKLIPLQSEKVGESEYELDKEKRANLIVQAAEGIILGNDAALSLISPIAFGRSFVEGGVDLVKGMGENLKEAIDLANEYNRKAMAGEEITAEDVLLPQSKLIEGAIKGGFAYMQATNPEVFAAWHLGNATGEAVLPETIVRTIMTPASMIIDNAGNDKLKQSVTNILDTFGNLVIFHKLSGLVKPNELARKVKNNEPLNGEETKAFVEALEKTGEEEAKKAVEKTEENNVLQAKKEELNNQLLEAEETIKNIPVGETPAEKIEAKLLKQKVVEATKPIEEELTKIIEKEHEEIAAEIGVVEPVESEPKKVEPVKVGEGAGKEEPKEVGSGVGGEVKPTPQKVKVLGKDVNMYNDYIPSKVEDIEPNAMYSFNANSKDGIPSLLHDISYANKREVNGVKSENWHASISGEELLKLYPKEQSLKETTRAETPTPTQESNVVEGSGGVGGDVTEAEKMQFGAGYKDYNFKKENVPTSKIKITEQPSLSERKDFIEDIKKNGIKEPIVVEYDKESDTYYVKNGNNRAAIAKELGIGEVPTIIAEYKEQSIKETTKSETPTPTQESNVVEGSGGVGGDVGSKSILKSDVDLKGDKKKSWMRKNSLDKISVNNINEEGHNNNLSSAKENVKAGKKSQTKEAPLVEIDENGNATIIDGHHRIAEDILDGKSHIEAVVDNKFNIRDAIKDGLYEKAISEGRMTAKDAKEIIESAGLKVPKEIESLLSKEQPKAETPTTTKESNVPVSETEVKETKNTDSLTEFFDKVYGNSDNLISEQTDIVQYEPSQTTKENIASTGEQSGVANSEKISGQKKGTIREAKQTRVQKALSNPPESAHEAVLQYFIGGGKLTSAAIQSFFGSKSKVEEGKNVIDPRAKKEMDLRIGLLNNKKGQSIDGVVHYLMQQRTDNEFTESEVKKALEEVILTNNGTSTMLDFFEGKEDKVSDKRQWEAMANSMGLDINEIYDEIDAADDYWQGLSDEEKEVFIRDNNIIEEKVVEEKEKKAVPPPPVSEEKKAENNEEKKNKSLLNRLMASETISNSVKEEIKKYGLTYDNFSHETANAIASEIVNSNTPEAALNEARHNEQLDGSVKVLIYANVINNYAKEEGASKNQDEKDYNAFMQGAIADEMDRFVRDSGRAISAVNYAYNNLNMSAKAIVAKEIVGLKRQNNEKAEKKGYRKLLGKIIDEFHKIEKEGADKPKTKREKRKKINKEIDSLLEQLKKSYNETGYTC